MFKYTFPRELTSPPLHNPLTEAIGRWHAKNIRRLEQRIGYRLGFPRIPGAWFQQCATFDLSRSWQDAGLNVTGVDYFTVGVPTAGRSTRFDPDAEAFQSWIGGYLVRLNEDRPYTFQEHLNLAVVDQVNWLRHYGDPHPACELLANGFQRDADTVVSGYPAAIYIGGGYSHADIGPGNGAAWLRVATSALAVSFNSNGSLPRARASNFIPKYATEAYARIFLKGIIIVVEIEPRVHAVLYGNGTIYRDGQGIERDTFQLIKDRLQKALLATTIARA